MFQCAEVLNLLNKNCGISKTSFFGPWDSSSLMGKAAEILGTNIRSGATKAVLVLEDMVIKVPFNTNDEVEEFFRANTNNGWDYCEVELNILKDARECGLEMCFAYQELVGDVNGYPVYAQEKCEIWGDIHNDEDYSKEKRISTAKYVKSKGYYCFNECWLSDFLDYYGRETLENFLAFIQEHDITDLHNYNIGYAAGRPVVVDYGDYNEEEDYGSWYDSWNDDEEKEESSY